MSIFSIIKRAVPNQFTQIIFGTMIFHPNDHVFWDAVTSGKIGYALSEYIKMFLVVQAQIYVEYGCEVPRDTLSVRFDETWHFSDCLAESSHCACRTGFLMPDYKMKWDYNMTSSSTPHLYQVNPKHAATDDTFTPTLLSTKLRTDRKLPKNHRELDHLLQNCDRKEMCTLMADLATRLRYLNFLKTHESPVLHDHWHVSDCPYKEERQECCFYCSIAFDHPKAYLKKRGRFVTPTGLSLTKRHLYL